MSTYELALLGTITTAERTALEATLGRMIEEFGLAIGTDVVIHGASTVAGRNRRAAFAAAYFGGSPHIDVDEAVEVARASAPVIPTIASGGDFSRLVPTLLQSFNGLTRQANDPDMVELASALLECVGLLRRQRRVFVSYRRLESRAAALQLHDLLNSRGFDVFLDTHDIRAGDPFQEVLWHRLVDSDVMVMLDTPGYFNSRWTRQEIGRARAKDIQVLRVIWPDHVPTKLTDFAETVHLPTAHLLGDDGPLDAQVADDIIIRVEDLRSRSIAARFMSITGKLRADVEKIGGVVEGVGAHRAIAIRLFDGRLLWAYPIVGIPTAEVFNDIADKAQRAAQAHPPVLVYDHVGIRESWSAHLAWLESHITSVQTIKVSEAGWALAALGE